MIQPKKVTLHFGNQEINIQITRLGECWWNLKDLCASLDVELLTPRENQDRLTSVAKALKLESNDIKEEKGEDGETEIMLNFPGLEKLVDYAGEIRTANDFCEWIVETAFPLIWENQQGKKEENEEETLILGKPQNQESLEIGLIAA